MFHFLHSTSALTLTDTNWHFLSTNSWFLLSLVSYDGSVHVNYRLHISLWKQQQQRQQNNNNNVYTNSKPLCNVNWKVIGFLSKGEFMIVGVGVPPHKIIGLPFHMMTSSNGNIFRVTGHLCRELTSHRWIPCAKASDAKLCVFFDLRLNNRLSKQSWGWWFETPSQSLRRHCNVTTHESNFYAMDESNFLLAHGSLIRMPRKTNCYLLTHRGRDKMATIFQTTFSNGFSSMKMFELRLKFDWMV